MVKRALKQRKNSREMKTRNIYKDSRTRNQNYLQAANRIIGGRCKDKPEMTHRKLAGGAKNSVAR